MSLEDIGQPDDVVITRSQAARLLKCDPRTVSRGIQAGSIPAIKLGRRQVIPRTPFLKLLGLVGGDI
jgi:excisionase family DNA binding protein